MRDLDLSLDGIAESDSQRVYFAEKCFTDLEDDPYALVWDSSRGIIDTQSGCIIAFDLTDEKDDKRVIHLGLDDCYESGRMLSPTFGDFVERLLAIGDLRLKEWYLLDYAPEDGDGLDPDCEAAQEFRQSIGLD